MYRSKDFMLMDVIDVNGKKIGYISDVLIDFNKKKVIGFFVDSYGLIKKSLNVLVEDIVGFNSVMIINNTLRKKLLEFKSVKGMAVKDRNSNILGMVEEILFCEKYFSIKAVVVSTGLITNFIHGKKIIVTRDLILGEESVLFNGKCEEISFLSLPHKLFREDDYYDKQTE